MHNIAISPHIGDTYKSYFHHTTSKITNLDGQKRCLYNIKNKTGNYFVRYSFIILQITAWKSKNLEVNWKTSETCSMVCFSFFFPNNAIITNNDRVTQIIITMSILHYLYLTYRAISYLFVCYRYDIMFEQRSMYYYNITYFSPFIVYRNVWFKNNSLKHVGLG